MLVLFYLRPTQALKNVIQPIPSQAQHPLGSIPADEETGENISGVRTMQHQTSKNLWHWLRIVCPLKKINQKLHSICFCHDY